MLKDIPQLNLASFANAWVELQAGMLLLLQARSLADGGISVYIVSTDEYHVTTRLQVCYSRSLCSFDHTHMQIKVNPMFINWIEEGK
jgi:hypothetical protein